MMSFVKLALYAAVIPSLSPFNIFVYASPLPMPLAMAETTITRYQIDSPVSRGLDSTSERVHNISTPVTRASKLHAKYLQSFQAYSAKVKENAATLKTLSARAQDADPDDTQFQQECVTSLAQFHDNLLGFQGLLEQLGADKGLANFDPDDPTQVLLKDIVNIHKDILNSTADMVNGLPVLGPLLGPVVYEIKCIVEYLLDFVENITDAVLTPLAPLLVPVLNALLITTTKASGDDCSSGISLGGLCLLEGLGLPGLKRATV